MLVFYIRKERKELRYGVKSFFLPEIENIFFEILLTDTKPLVARTIYRQPSQSDFLKAVITHVLGDFNKLLGNFNINLYLDNSYIFQKIIYFKANRFLVTSKNNMNSVKCLDLKQLIEAPTCVACKSSTIIDHRKVPLMWDCLMMMFFTTLDKNSVR